MNRWIGFLLLVGVLIGGSTVWAGPTDSDPDQSVKSEECGEAAVQFGDDSSLTQQERLAAMDRALDQSLNKYDSCITPTEAASSSSQSSASGAGTGSAGENGTGNGNPAVISSTPASDISGTESEFSPPPGQAVPIDPSDQTASATPQNQRPKNLPNGKPPDDIPTSDNDSILQAQIRQAAINETDPEKKARLWDEYRKYKGLPQKQH